MKIGIKNNNLFKNAFVLSSIVHGVAIYFFVNWPATGSVKVPEVEPIQITEIIFESPEPMIEPKVKKKVVLPTPPVKNNIAKFSNPQTASIKPRKIKVKRTNPILASARNDLKRRFASSVNNPKSIQPLTVKKTVPVVSNANIFLNQIRQPNNSVRPVQVAERISNKLNSFPRTLEVKRTIGQFRRPSVQPVHYVQKASISEPLLQRDYVRDAPNRYRKASDLSSKIKARNFSNVSNPLVYFGKPVQEERRNVRPVSISRVQPVQLASMKADIVAVSKGVDIMKDQGPSSVLTSPVASAKDIATLTKGFASSVRGKILVAKYYPSIAQERRWEGKPVVEFQVGKNGELLNYSILVASPYEALNQAAIDAVKKASPFPQIPDLLNLNSLIFKIPIAFTLGDSS